MCEAKKQGQLMTRFAIDLVRIMIRTSALAVRMGRRVPIVFGDGIIMVSFQILTGFLYSASSSKF